jgi:hypothetical protein
MQLECTVFLTLDIQPTASKTEILLELQNYKIPYSYKPIAAP